MRKHLYLIIEHPDEGLVGNVEMTTHRHERVTKNEVGPIDRRNMESGELTQYSAVGLGYYDFEDEEQYEETAMSVVQEKLTEIDAKWLEKAGVEPEVPA